MAVAGQITLQSTSLFPKVPEFNLTAGYLSEATFFVDRLATGPVIDGTTHLMPLNNISAAFKIRFAPNMIIPHSLMLMDNTHESLEDSVTSVPFEELPWFNQYISSVALSCFNSVYRVHWHEAFKSPDPLLRLNDFSQDALNHFLRPFKEACGYLIFEGVDQFSNGDYYLRIGELYLNLNASVLFSVSVSGELRISPDGAITDSKLYMRTKPLNAPYRAPESFSLSLSTAWVYGPLVRNAHETIGLMHDSPVLCDVILEQLASAALREAAPSVLKLNKLDQPYVHAFEIKERAGFSFLPASIETSALSHVDEARP